jgi:capsular polysaccharide biosynthesis protein
VAVGLVGAVAVGAGSAFAADYMDPALRTPDEVLACLEIPVLASLPEERERQLSA